MMIYIIAGIVIAGLFILLGWGGVNYHQIENDLRRGNRFWRRFW